MQFLLHLVQGMLIGTGGILPGVSGGALCVIFGVYRPLMDVLAHPFKNLRKHFMLLFPVGIGIGVGFVGLASLLKVVMQSHEAQAICVFVGLILGMIPQLYREAGEQGRGKGAWITLILSAACLTAAFLYLQNRSGFSITPNFGWWIFCGVVWGLSVIIPGMSSSSVMILCGLFDAMIAGISALKLTVIVPIAIGVLLSIGTLSRAVNLLFKKHHTITYHFILGAVIATMIPIIPRHFSGVWDIVLDIICAAGGFLLSILIQKVSQKRLHETPDDHKGA